MGQLFNALSHLFGNILNIIYSGVGNFGIAVILFAIVVKIIQTPLEIKSRIINAQAMKMAELQKGLREKYKNNTQKLNEELIKLYKKEGVNPLASLGGLFLGFFNIFLIIAMFNLVYSPLTYMRDMNKEKIDEYYNKAIEIKYNQEYEGKTEESKDVILEKIKKETSREKEILIIRYLKDTEYNDAKINMNFATLDLTNKPNEKVTNFKDGFKPENLNVMLIPITYILISVININIMQKDLEKQREQNKKLKGENPEAKVIENKNKAEDDDKMTSEDFEDVMMQSNKMMMYIMPFMIFSITMITPLGVALYWLATSIADIVKIRIVKKIADKKLEEKGLNVK